MTMHANPFGTPELYGKTVLVRVDIEAIAQSGHAPAMHALAGTIGELTSRRARVILLSHRGDPHGEFVPALSLRNMAVSLSQAIDKVVTFIPGCVGEESAFAISTVSEGSVGLLENLGFDAGEDANDPTFARKLASLGDYHINALAVTGVPRASTHAIAEFLPSYAIPHAA